MIPADRLKAYGTAVVELPVERTRNDAIVHTVHHFLNNDELWQHVAPHPDAAPGELDPRDVVKELRARGVRLDGIGKEAPFDPCWWEREDRAQLLRDAHDCGYYPRYAGLAHRAGAFLAPGSAWGRVGESEEAVADIDGYQVRCLRTREGLKVITAYRQYVLRPSSSRRAFATVGDQHEARSQQTARRRVPRPEDDRS